MAKYMDIGVAVSLVLLFIQYTIYIDAKYIEPNYIKLEKLHIINKNFPRDLNKLRIIHITDLHIKKIGFRERNLIKKINALKPDIILITGDFTAGKEDLFPALSVLSRLEAKKGIYGVLGDNDRSDFKMALENIKIHMIDNRNIRIPINNAGWIWLIGGVIDRIGRQSYLGVNLSEPKILLIHSAERIDEENIDPENTDLILSGDTHGGQVGISFIRNFSDIVKEYRYVSGLFHVKGVPLYVNRGIGVQGRRKTIRFFCRPEITLITLSKE